MLSLFHCMRKDSHSYKKRASWTHIRFTCSIKSILSHHIDPLGHPAYFPIPQITHVVCIPSLSSVFSVSLRDSWLVMCVACLLSCQPIYKPWLLFLNTASRRKVILDLASPFYSRHTICDGQIRTDDSVFIIVSGNGCTWLHNSEAKIWNFGNTLY